jgi:hypothetical protein
VTDAIFAALHMVAMAHRDMGSLNVVGRFRGEVDIQRPLADLPLKLTALSSVKATPARSKAGRGVAAEATREAPLPAHLQ